MEEKFFSLITEIGKQKITNAVALGKKVELSNLCLGDGDGGYYEISESQTALKNQVWEGGLSRVVVGQKNKNEILAEAYIPTDVGGFYIREAGIKDKDGDLIAIAKHPETFKPIGEFGAYKDITIRMILSFSNAANVVLKVDPSIVVATQKDLKDLAENIPQMIDTDAFERIEHKNKVDGYAGLDGNGKVPKSLLYPADKGLTLGETEDTAYRGDRGKIAYDHSQSPHAPSNAYSKESMDTIINNIKKGMLTLGETSDTAYRGDRGKLAYDHSRSAHLGLGETSATAYRGDRGKIAYDHSQSPHAPVDALSRTESYSRAELDSRMNEVKTYRDTLPDNEYMKNRSLTAYKRNGVVTLTIYGETDYGERYMLPAGFRPVCNVRVLSVVNDPRAHESSGTVNISTNGRVSVDAVVHSNSGTSVTYLTKE